MSLLDKVYLVYSFNQSQSSINNKQTNTNNIYKDENIYLTNPLLELFELFTNNFLPKESFQYNTELNNQTYINDFQYNSSSTNSKDFKNYNNTYLNNTYIIEPKSKYLNLILGLAITLLVLAYYFSTYKRTKLINNKNLRESISIAFFLKALSLIYSYFTENSKLDDKESYLNFALSHFSRVYFQTILLDYASTLIEKYYNLTMKKEDFFLKHFFFMFKVTYFISFFILLLSYLAIEQYLTMDYVFFIINGAVDVFISVLYLYYGVSLAKVYSNKDYSINNFTDDNIKANILNNIINQEYNNLNVENHIANNDIDKKKYLNSNCDYNDELNNLNKNVIGDMNNIQQANYPRTEEFKQLSLQIANTEQNKKLRSRLKIKLYIISLTVSITQIFQGLLFFILGVNYYGKPYFKFMNPNMFDFLTGFIGTLVCGFVLGYQRISNKQVSYYEEDYIDNDLTDKFIDNKFDPEFRRSFKTKNSMRKNINISYKL